MKSIQIKIFVVSLRKNDPVKLRYINVFIYLFFFEAVNCFFERKFESLKERLLRRTYLTRIDVRETFVRETL